MTSTRMSMSQEVQKILDKARNLNNQNDMYRQSPKPPSTPLNVSSLTSELLSAVDYEDMSDLDIIELGEVDLSDDESWLCASDKPSSTSSIADVYQWLRKDLDAVKDTRYQAHQLMLQHEMGRMECKANNDSKLSVYFDSRTFTRPRKKMSRPSLETVLNSSYGNSFTYLNNSNASREDSFQLGSESKRRLNAYVQNLNGPSEFYSEDSNSFSRQIHHLTDKLKDVQMNRSNEHMVNHYGNKLDISDRLEDIIREQENELATSTNFSSKDQLAPKSGGHVRATHSQEHVSDRPFKNSFESIVENHGDSFQSMSPPSLISSFASVNLTSLTESDFITAMSQPQDLYTSFTSTATNDLAEDQHEIMNNETFATDVKDLHETFSKEIGETRLGDNSDPVSVNDVTFTAPVPEVLSPNATFTTASNHYLASTFVTPVDSGPQSMDFHHYDQDSPDAAFKTFRKNKSIKAAAPIVTDVSGDMNCEELDQQTASPQRVNHLVNGEMLAGGDNEQNCDGNATFSTANLHKISHSDPNLLDDSNEDLNNTFSMARAPREFLAASVDNLNKTRSESRLSASPLKYGMSRLATVQKQRLQHIASTPKPNQKLITNAWASSETLSPVRHSSRDLTSDESDVSFEDVKTARSAGSSLNSSPLKVCMKTPGGNMTRLMQPVRSLRPPLDIGKSNTDLDQPTVVHVETRRVPSTLPSSAAPQIPRQSMLRQPMARSSGLPRPTSSATTLGSGIPRPPTRLPAPRVLKAPSSRPATAKSNNWRDGCY